MRARTQKVSFQKKKKMMTKHEQRTLETFINNSLLKERDRINNLCQINLERSFFQQGFLERFRQ